MFIAFTFRLSEKKYKESRGIKRDGDTRRKKKVARKSINNLDIR